MRTTKKILSMILAFVLVLGLLPATAFATGADSVYISVSYDGQYINDKNGNAIAYIPVSFENLASIDLDEYGLSEYKYDAFISYRHLEKDMSQAKRLYDLLDYFEMHQSKSGALTYYNSKYDPISYGTMTNLLTDTLLYGEYKGVPDYVQPYITKERFDRIQGILKRSARYSKNNNRVFFFSGINFGRSI